MKVHLVTSIDKQAWQKVGGTATTLFGLAVDWEKNWPVCCIRSLTPENPGRYSGRPPGMG